MTCFAELNAHELYSINGGSLFLDVVTVTACVVAVVAVAVVSKNPATTIKVAKAVAAPAIAATAGIMSHLSD